MYRLNERRVIMNELKFMYTAAALQELCEDYKQPEPAHPLNNITSQRVKLVVSEEE